MQTLRYVYNGICNHFYPNTQEMSLPDNNDGEGLIVSEHDETRKVSDLTAEAPALLPHGRFLNSTAIYNGLTAVVVLASYINSVVHGDPASFSEYIFDVAVHSFNFSLVAVPYLLTKAPALRRYVENSSLIPSARTWIVANIGLNIAREAAILIREASHSTTIPPFVAGVDFFINHPMALYAAHMHLRNLAPETKGKAD